MKCGFTLVALSTARTIGFGVVNIHIASKNCLWILKTGVECAVSHWHVLGPLFFKDIIDQNTYQDIMTQFISLLEQDGLLLFSARWYYMSYLKQNNVLLEKLFWWLSYFQGLVTPKISWFNLSQLLSFGLLKRQQPAHIGGVRNQYQVWECKDNFSNAAGSFSKHV